MSTEYNWEEVADEAHQLLESGVIEPTFAALSRHLNIPRTTLNEHDAIRTLVEQAKMEDQPDENVSYTFAEDGSKTVERIILLSEADMDDPAIVLEKMGLDPIRWNLLHAEFDRKSWQVTMKLAQGSDEHGNKLPEKPSRHTNYAYRCKIRVEPLQDRLDASTIRSVFDSLEAPELEALEYTHGDNVRMLEFGIYDPHFGKFAWEDETGDENYDLDIADKTMRAVVRQVVGRVRAYDVNIDQVLFPVGQDFYHIDNPEDATSSGTYVGADTRWQKIYQVGLKSLIWAVTQLREIAPVHICYVPGNHDQMMSYFATHHLNAWFRSVDGVEVDTSPTPRKYFCYGKNLIGFSHGKEGKKRIEKLMQVEVPEMWGRTKYREFHLGDLHHELTWESGGIIFRRISPFTASDAWHANKGYMGAQRKGMAFIWDPELGLDKILHIPI